jgi:hypothetical protein
LQALGPLLSLKEKQEKVEIPRPEKKLKSKQVKWLDSGQERP